MYNSRQSVGGVECSARILTDRVGAKGQVDSYGLVWWIGFNLLIDTVLRYIPLYATSCHGEKAI